LAQAIGCVGWQKLVKSFFFFFRRTISLGTALHHQPMKQKVLPLSLTPAAADPAPAMFYRKHSAAVQSLAFRLWKALTVYCA